MKSADVSVRQEVGDFDRFCYPLEAAVAAGPWLFGERLPVADVMIGLLAQRKPQFELTITGRGAG